MRGADSCTRVNSPPHPLEHSHPLAEGEDGQVAHDGDANPAGRLLGGGALPQIRLHEACLALTEPASTGDEVRFWIGNPLGPERLRAHALLMCSRLLTRQEILALGQTGREMRSLLTHPGPPAQPALGIAAPVLLAEQEWRRARAAYQALARVHRDPAALTNARAFLRGDARTGGCALLACAGVTSLGAWGTATLDGDWRVYCEVLLSAGSVLSLAFGCCAVSSCIDRRRLRNPDIDLPHARQELARQAFDAALSQWLGMAPERPSQPITRRWLHCTDSVADGPAPQLALRVASTD